LSGACSSHGTTVGSLVVYGGGVAGQVDREVAAKQEVTWQWGVEQDGGGDAERCCREDQKQNSVDNHCYLHSAHWQIANISLICAPVHDARRFCWTFYVFIFMISDRQRTNGLKKEQRVCDQFLATLPKNVSLIAINRTSLTLRCKVETWDLKNSVLLVAIWRKNRDERKTSFFYLMTFRAILHAGCGKKVNP